MARGRILSKSISHSVKIARLYQLNPDLGEFSALLFSWIIPHTDDFGQISADPMSIKFEVLSNSPRNIDEIQEAIYMLYKVKLIQLGDCDNEPVLVVINSEEHQSFRSDRTKQNKFPEAKWHTIDIPTTYPWASLSAQGKLREVKLSEVEGKRRSPDGDPPQPKTHKCSRHGKIETLICEKCETRTDIFNSQFWPVYPPRKGKRSGKKKALERFLNVPEKKIPLVMVGVRNYAVFARDTGEYPKDAEGWLSQGLYEEWQMPHQPEPPKQSPTARRYREKMEEKNARD